MKKSSGTPFTERNIYRMLQFQLPRMKKSSGTRNAWAAEIRAVAVSTSPDEEIIRNLANLTLDWFRE